MNKRLQTGISDLDKQLNGGFPPGAIVTCTTDSRTQSELFFHRLLSQHDAGYISTIGNEATVEAEFAKSPEDISNVNIGYASPDAMLQNSKSYMDKMNTYELIVVNTVSDLENSDYVDRGAYQEFLNWLQNIQQHTGCVVILHRFESQDENKYTHITNTMSDIIMELEEYIDGENVMNYLHIPKCRGGMSLDERMKIKLQGKMSVDTSRDIA